MSSNITKQTERKASPAIAILLRNLSTLGDDLWAIAVPVGAAIAGLTEKRLGVQLSAFAVGSIFGAISGTTLIARLGTLRALRTLALAGALTTFGAAAGFLLQHGYDAWFYANVFFQFALGAITLMAFTSTEKYISDSGGSSDFVKLHRLNLLLGYTLSLLCPLAGAFTHSMLHVKILFGLNAVTYLIEFALLPREISSASHEAKSVVPHLSFFDGLPMLLKRKFLFRITLIPVLAKVFVFGVIPFSIFRIKQSDLSFPVQFTALCCSPVGGILGSYFSKRVTESNPARGLTFWCAILVTAGLATFWGAKTGVGTLMAAGMLFAGISGAHYTLRLRSIRQLRVDVHERAAIFSSQAFVARLLTPLGGLILPILLGASSAIALSMYGSIFVLILTFAYLSEKEFH